MTPTRQYRERLSDPLWLPEWASYPVLRLACRLFGLHSPGCRGRRDHLALLRKAEPSGADMAHPQP